jgi:hypothetical protein
VHCGKYILSAANRGFQKSRVLVKVASERAGRGVLHAPLLLEAGITCSLSTYERNDEVITPHIRENPRHALVGVGNHGNSIMCVRI